MPVWAPVVFVLCAGVSIVASHRLVRALEALGIHFAVPEMLLGLVAAVAADGPELTSALAAQISGRHSVGAGVLFGSNVFNIAALLGLGAAVAGPVAFHRKAVVLEGAVALAVAAGSVLMVTGWLPVGAAAGLGLVAVVPYLVVATLPSRMWPFPRRARGWLSEAVKQEAQDLVGGYPSDAPSAPRREALIAAVAMLLVIGASVAMEESATVAGQALGWSPVIVGAVVLAAVTSLPNVVAALYLARAGRGAAMLSEAMNSNTMNVLGGLFVPVLIGAPVLRGLGAGPTLTAASYLGLSALALAIAFTCRGMARWAGGALVLLYAAFLAALFATV
ncbi:MAG TPA: hypothetical protein VFN61_13010 [Acidimicrobiales bacterium]|nr:hypothetical protein [Acidimicrobiales bacterium]